MWLTPRFLPGVRVVQCVEPSAGLRRVAERMRPSILGVSTLATLPRCREWRPAREFSRKRFFQRDTYVGLQPNPSTIASNVSPSASIRINRAFRASSARLLRERTRSSSASRTGRLRTRSGLGGMRHDARSHYRFQRYSALANEAQRELSALAT